MRNFLVRRGGLRSAALMSVAAVLAAGLVTSMSPAHAKLTPGHRLNALQVPRFYKDSRGVALQLCAAKKAALCEPAGAGHLGVYFTADATAGPLHAIYAIEAARDAGHAIVSNVTRFRLDGRPNTRYRIHDPWGISRCRTDGSGTADCRHETNGAFRSVHKGHIRSFLRSAANPDGVFVGNANVTGRVLGSPDGFNRIKVTGGGRTFITRRFTLMGQKRANTAMSAVSTDRLVMGRPRRTKPVVRKIRYSSFGTRVARPTVSRAGKNPHAFRVQNQCASVAPGSACNLVVTFWPRRHANDTMRARLVIRDNGLTGARRVHLKGVGVRR